MKESGRVRKEMDSVPRNGLMGLGMKGSGWLIRLVGRVSFFMWMETCLRENGEMIRPMGMVCICTSTGQSTKVNGKMTCSMEKGWKYVIKPT